MKKEQVKAWIENNLVLQDEARGITNQSVPAFNQSVQNGKIKPFVEFGEGRKTRLYLKEDLEVFAKNKRRANTLLNVNILIVKHGKLINATVASNRALEKLFNSFYRIVQFNNETVEFVPEFNDKGIKVYARFDNSPINEMPVAEEITEEKEYTFATESCDLEVYVSGNLRDDVKYFEKVTILANTVSKDAETYVKSISSNQEGYITKEGFFLTNKTEWKHTI